MLFFFFLFSCIFFSRASMLAFSSAFRFAREHELHKPYKVTAAYDTENFPYLFAVALSDSWGSFTSFTFPHSVQ